MVNHALSLQLTGALIGALLLLAQPAEAAADSGLRIEVESCSDVDADAIAQIVEADFNEANEGKSTIAITCVGQVASLRMLEAGTTAARTRQVDLSNVAPIARARMLALLVVELLDVGQNTEALATPQELPKPPPVSSVPVKEAPGVAQLRSKKKKEPSSPLRQPQVLVGLELGVSSRTFGYQVAGGVTNAPNVRPFESPLVPIARLDAQAYPFPKDSQVSGLGLSASFAAAHTVKSSTSDGMNLLSSRSEWDLNLRYQRVLRLATIAAEVGGGQQRFAFREEDPSSGSTLIDEVPMVNIRYARIAMDLEVPVSDTIGLALGIDYRSVSSIGALSQRFQSTTVNAWAADLGAHYWVTESIRLRLLYLRSSYSYIFESADITQARGDDAFTTLVIGVGIQR